MRERSRIPRATGRASASAAGFTDSGDASSSPIATNRKDGLNHDVDVTRKKLLALMFDLRAENGNVGTLIAWLNESGQATHLKHSHPQRSLLEARAGDRLVFRNRHVVTVLRIKPWRTTECRDETQYDWIKSGMDWERDMESNDRADHRD